MIIVWDVDDVLNDLMHSWFNHSWLAAHPRCTLSYADLKENPPDCVLGVTREEYLSSLDTFRATQGRNLLANPLVLGWLEAFGHRFDHWAVTACPRPGAEGSSAWVFEQFGRYIKNFSIVPCRGEDGSLTPANKIAFLRRVSRLGEIAAVVDDNAATITDAQAAGLLGFLYSRPWNAAPEHPEEMLGRMGRVLR